MSQFPSETPHPPSFSELGDSRGEYIQKQIVGRVQHGPPCTFVQNLKISVPASLCFLYLFRNFRAETFLSSTHIPHLHIPLSHPLHHHQTTTANTASMVPSPRMGMCDEARIYHSSLDPTQARAFMRMMLIAITSHRRAHAGIGAASTRPRPRTTAPLTMKTSRKMTKADLKCSDPMGPKRSLNAWMGFRCQYIPV